MAKYLKLFYNRQDALGIIETPAVYYVDKAPKPMYASTKLGNNAEVIIDDTPNSATIKARALPYLKVTVGDSTDTAVLSLTCEKNTSVDGEIVWSCNLPSDTVKIEGTNLTFIKHYDGEIKLTATATNISDSKTITVTCDEEVISTTYTLGTVSPNDYVKADVTSAIINYTVIPTYHYKLKDDVVGNAISASKEVTFAKNTDTKPIVREGSFTDSYGVVVNWSITQKRKVYSNVVDLDLPSGTLWATCNLGASKPEEVGSYYQWGSTKGYSDFFNSWPAAPFNNGSSTFNKSYFDAHMSEWLNGYILKDEYNAAVQNWYLMPTKADLDELVANTIYTWETINGVEGGKLTSKKDPDSYIFIPATTFAGSIWSSQLSSSQHASAYILEVNPNRCIVSIKTRCMTYQIRGIIK